MSFNDIHAVTDTGMGNAKEDLHILHEIQNKYSGETDMDKRRILMEDNIKIRRKLGWHISADLFEKDFNNGEF